MGAPLAGWMRPHRPTSASAFTPMPGAQPTALGFFRGDRNGHRILLHDGDGTGAHADMELLMDDRVGFFSVVNSDGTGGLIGAAYGFRSALFRLPSR